MCERERGGTSWVFSACLARMGCYDSIQDLVSGKQILEALVRAYLNPSLLINASLFLWGINKSST